MKKKVLLGVGEFGCWECTLTPQIPDPDAKDEPQPEKLWVMARTLAEIAENLPGVESAVLLGKATCIADPLTSGVQQPAPDLTQAIQEAAYPIPTFTQPEGADLPEITLEQARQGMATCPYCGETFMRHAFVKPEGLNGDFAQCPNPSCRMLSPAGRLIKVG